MIYSKAFKEIVKKNQPRMFTYYHIDPIMDLLRISQNRGHWARVFLGGERILFHKKIEYSRFFKKKVMLSQVTLVCSLAYDTYN